MLEINNTKQLKSGDVVLYKTAPERPWVIGKIGSAEEGTILINDPRLKEGGHYRTRMDNKWLASGATVRRFDEVCADILKSNIVFSWEG